MGVTSESAKVSNERGGTSHVAARSDGRAQSPCKTYSARALYSTATEISLGAKGRVYQLGRARVEGAVTAKRLGLR